MNTEQSSAEHFIFRARSRRVARYGKYSGKPATVLFDHADGKRLVLCDKQRFSVYPDELIALAKPIHGSPDNYTFNNDGSLR